MAIVINPPCNDVTQLKYTNSNGLHRVLKGASTKCVLKFVTGKIIYYGIHIVLSSFQPSWIIHINLSLLYDSSESLQTTN
nr:MAG TPA: hypothetical protein [Caudoviricetes sp.]